MGRTMKFFALVSIAFACKKKGGSSSSSKPPSCSKTTFYCPDGSSRYFHRKRVTYTGGVWPFTKRESRCVVKDKWSDVFKDLKENCRIPSGCDKKKWDEMISDPVCIDGKDDRWDEIVKLGHDLDKYDFDVGCVSHDRCYFLPDEKKADCDKWQRLNHRRVCYNKFHPNDPERAACYTVADLVWTTLSTLPEAYTKYEHDISLKYCK